MHRRTLVLTTMALLIAGCLAIATPARAQDPAGCVGNRFHVDLLKDRTYIRDGETINYRVALRNNDGGACTVSRITVLLQLPAADGNPAPALPALVQNQAYAAGTPEITFGPFPYTADFKTASPPRYVARVSIANGELRDTPPPYSVLNIDRTLQTLTVHPALTIDKVGSTTGGPAPQTVTYTYSVRNTTTPATIPDSVSAVSNVTPTDDRCAPLTYASGDANTDGKLQMSETWVYTCTKVFAGAGTFTNTATVCADSVIDNIPKNVCSPPDTWTVTVTPPPPQARVLPASATQAPCTLRTRRHLRVRARQLNTIRVRVRTDQPVAKKRVRLRLPGTKKWISRKTNAKGVATFRVRPKRSGRARLRAGDCGKARISVKPARRVAARRIPRVTG